MRGDRRRQALLDAAVEVIARDGVSGVTHRAVAAAAGVPPASPNYYFESVDDILVAALTEASDRYIAACNVLAEAVRQGADFATALADMIIGDTTDPRLALAEYELYLLAARRPELRPIALRWAKRLSKIAAEVIPDRAAVRAIITLVEGVCVQKILGKTLSRKELRAALTALTDPGACSEPSRSTPRSGSSAPHRPR